MFLGARIPAQKRLTRALSRESFKSSLAAMNSMDVLHDEIITEIFTYLDGSIHKRPFVSRRFYAQAIPFLYRNLRLNPEEYPSTVVLLSSLG